MAWWVLAHLFSPCLLTVMGTTGTTSYRLAAAVGAGLLLLIAAQIGAQNPPADLLLTDPNNVTGNASRNCLNRGDNHPCPDPDLRFYLYSGDDGNSDLMDVSDPAWFNTSRYNPDLPTVMLVHGYRGGDSLMPMVVLKNAYIKQGAFNVITVDWGEFVRAPCYLQAVNNMKIVAKCMAHMLSYLQDAGVENVHNITCVGHSLGAHVCGILANYVKQPMERIIALDPARPLLQFSWPNDRVDAKDAKIVQVIHSDTKFYGLSGSQGTVDFCVNNGAQPFCDKTRNDRLCSHAHAICFQAESLYPDKAQKGYPCENSCPNNKKILQGDSVFIGEYMESSAKGMYCVTTSNPPYCSETSDEPGYGDINCCPVYPPSRRKFIINKNRIKTFDETEESNEA